MSAKFRDLMNNTEPPGGHEKLEHLAQTTTKLEDRGPHNS